MQRKLALVVDLEFFDLWRNVPVLAQLLSFAAGKDVGPLEHAEVLGLQIQVVETVQDEGPCADSYHYRNKIGYLIPPHLAN